MKSLLIATTNPAKLLEYRILLRDLPLKLVSLGEAGLDDPPEETGATFVENALLKARFYFRISGIPSLADDGGLEVDALGGAPGVLSHRWLGEELGDDDRALADEVIRRMTGAPTELRTARMRAAAAIIWRENLEARERVAEAALEGIIPERACDRIQPGFPYRSVLFIPRLKRYVAEFSEEEAAQLSQRRAAIAELRNTLLHLAEIA